MKEIPSIPITNSRDTGKSIGKLLGKVHILFVISESGVEVCSCTMTLDLIRWGIIVTR